MSSSLGIAAVTAVLRHILLNRLAGDPVASAIGTVGVSAGAPDRVDLSGAADPNHVNIFLHQVSRNAGFANEGLPARDLSGRRTSAPPLALDLHYLITAYGAEPFYAEIIMGEIAQELHERPVPAVEVIEAALNPTTPPVTFPTQLSQSGLARQIERLRITQEWVSNEEISKLWSALQARYRATLAYRVTTVIIESQAPARPALPVRRRLGYAFGAQTPQIASVLPAADRFDPIMAGTPLVVTGRGLNGSIVAVYCDGTDLTSALTLRTDERFELTLPTPLPAGMRAGINALRIVHRHEVSDPPSVRDAVTSNLAPFVIRPEASVTAGVSDSTVIDGVTYNSGSLTLTLTPPVIASQRVQLLLNPVNAATPGARGFALRAPDGNGITPPAVETASVDVAFANVPAGDYLFRAVVDGAESPLTSDASGAYDGPVVTI